MGEIIQGKEIAGRIKEQIKKEVEQLKKTMGIVPKLAVVLVGENPASKIYVRNKEKACAEVGILSETVKLPEKTTKEEIIGEIERLNKGKELDGILVQLPLPAGIKEAEILEKVDPHKDVDGLHVLNLGKLLKGEKPHFLPCTPQGIMEIILSTGEEIKGKEAVVVGRSNIVGKPIALMLLEKHATVTICHSRTRDLASEVARADILVAAVGKPEIIKGSMIKKGAIVIDVGTTHIEGKWVGDVEFEEALKRASYITPVPGGVGPMTIAMLLKNTHEAARLRAAKNAQ